MSGQRDRSSLPMRYVEGRSCLEPEPELSRRRCVLLSRIFRQSWEVDMHGIVWLIGFIVILFAILSFLGLR